MAGRGRGSDVPLGKLFLTSTDFEGIVSEIAVSAQSEDAMPHSPPTLKQFGKLLELGKKYGLTILPLEHNA